MRLLLAFGYIYSTIVPNFAKIHFFLELFANSYFAFHNSLSCGYINHNLTLAMREWICPKCGSIHDRDLLAANNIKRFAFRNINTVGTTEIYACGDMSEHPHSAQEAHESSVRG